MARVTLLLVALLVIGVLVSFSSTPASAQTTSQPSATAPAGEYPDVSGVPPFSAASNFMSVPGFLRWQTFRDQGIWISYAEARRITLAQGGELYHRA